MNPIQYAIARANKQLAQQGKPQVFLEAGSDGRVTASAVPRQRSVGRNMQLAGDILSGSSLGRDIKPEPTLAAVQARLKAARTRREKNQRREHNMVLAAADPSIADPEGARRGKGGNDLLAKSYTDRP